MSREVFEIIQKLDLKDVETQLALQCAPLISGLKMSNLLVIQKGSFAKLQAILKKTNIFCYVLLDRGEKITVLLFYKDELEMYLEDSRVKQLLQEMGYPSNSLAEILSVFRKRYREHMACRAHFPHEMGILLGYPIEDVEGFIHNNGKNFLYTGYWKVYENIPEKEQLFRRFELVKEAMIQLVSFGVSMRDIIEIYRDERLQKAAV